MHTHSLAEQFANSPSRWLTTQDAARMLERSAWSVRWLARTGRLPRQTTRSGQYLFREDVVNALVTQRAKARLRGVYVGRPRRQWTSDGPRQLSLFRPRLQLVAANPPRDELIHGGVDTTAETPKETIGVR